jgi:hypothetical protein
VQAMLQSASEKEEGMKDNFWLALAIFIYAVCAVISLTFIALLLVEGSL